MYCQNCGNKLEDNAVICTNCGTSVVNESNRQVNENPPNRFNDNSESQQQAFESNENKKISQQPVATEDKPNIVVNILSLCCIPILGVVMFFVWKDSHPKAAKSALIFSLINIALGVVLYIILAALGLFTTVIDPTTYE